MAPEITRITQEFLSNPERVEVARQATTSETITQKICQHKPSRRDRSDSEKRNVLRNLIDGEADSFSNAIVFCNRKRDVDIVAKSLKKYGYDAAPIHGDLDQSVRMATLGEFRGGDLKILVASDVAARGLDIPDVSHVLNYDVPIHAEDYVHRIGRTGRAGKLGTAITICFPHEEKYLEKIEELVKKEIERVPSPISKTEEKQAVEESPPSEEPKKRAPRGRGKQADQNNRQAKQGDGNNPKERSERSGGERRRRSEPRSTVPGMGDHMPAFLLTEFRVAKPPAGVKAEVTDG